MNKEMDAFILAGGRSSRMGFDKASLTLGGVGVIKRISNALSGIADDIYVAGGEGEIAGLKRFPDVADEGSERSSLAGLYSALTHATTDWIAVAACDMPFITAGLFQSLAERRFGGSDAVIPRDISGTAQPLCGLYRVGPGIEACRIALTGMDLSLRSMLAGIETIWVDFADIAHLPDSERFFINLNTPEEAAAAETLLVEGVGR
ncbi:MAG: molybdenum cofactor guanylyltransferase [Pyrinomonadaceae bacterium]|nr:molybdenum cofactor guanylyltransferase [Pyrinomonadaceae bacterium]